MSIFGDMLTGAMGAKMPAFNPSYIWEIQWLFEDEQCPPHIFNHPKPQDALNQMISLWNSNRTLIYLSIARRNA